MGVSMCKALREGAVILLIIAGGLVAGALTPAYSQNDAPASASAAR